MIKSKLLMITLMICLPFVQNCSHTPPQPYTQNFDGYNKVSKYIGKEIEFKKGFTRLETYGSPHRIKHPELKYSPYDRIVSETATVRFIADDQSHFLAQVNNSYDKTYVIVPFDWLAEGKAFFLDDSLNKGTIDKFKRRLTGARMVTAEVIDEMIEIAPKEDKFITKQENEQIKLAFFKKQGIFKTTIALSPRFYDPESKVWQGLFFNKLKSDTIVNATTVGSNAYGVTIEYDIITTHYWKTTFKHLDNLPQSPEDARNAQSITLYGEALDAEVYFQHEAATLKDPIESYNYGHLLKLDIFLGEVTLKDGTRKYVFPIYL